MNTTALEKLAVSMINLLPSLGAVVLLSQFAYWRVVLVGTFLLYQLIIAATPSKRSIGMRLMSIQWAESYSMKSHVVFAFLYSLSLGTAAVWVFFPFDLLLVNLLLIQLPMVLLTGCTLHGYFSGQMYGVRMRPRARSQD